MIIITIILLALFPTTFTCARTSTTSAPVVTDSPITTSTTTTTTTTAAPTGCCPALTQTLTSTSFPDGTMTFSYDSDTCRGSVTATCSSSDPATGLYAAIVANGDNFLDYGLTTVSFPGTCNATDQSWYMGTPSLLVQTLECILTTA